ncbi:hypothetical protein MPTK1_8g00600 [Marchantia polymorpha subsp. ruderalis]|uniref:Uncharacterized protein n=1 Tax=Marchantia polymorpha TaxID=3197 RepID=A0A2R6WLG3_MARPO|nr:hypothetical protein MARPO_0077s0015 [Marchantia polymorpha]BBN18202.1 hypothetical protein Mp_8g00600 [Marchantia polymorpha subsp. ruderalis]|eukprot:PTQ34685.1 hypothetical protein MARPO_0077s0015 [Marchantia polymorpha]
MGVWRRLKGWMKRTVLGMVMRVVRTRLYKFLRKIARASVVPLSITAGAAGVGVGVASLVAFPLLYGGLIGASAGAVAVLLARLWLRQAEAERSRRKSLTTFSFLSKKVRKKTV